MPGQDNEYAKAVYRQLKGISNGKLTVSEEDFIEKISTDDTYAKAAYQRLKSYAGDKLSIDESGFISQVKKKEQSVSGSGSESGTSSKSGESGKPQPQQPKVDVNQVMGEGALGGVKAAKIKAESAPLPKTETPKPRGLVVTEFGVLPSDSQPAQNAKLVTEYKPSTPPLSKERLHYLEQQQVVEEKAKSAGVTPKQYRQAQLDIASENFVTPDVRKEYEVLKDIERANNDLAVAKSTGNKDIVAAAEVRKTLYENKYADIQAKRLRSIDTEIAALKSKITFVGDSYGGRDFREQFEEQIKDLEFQKSLFFKTKPEQVKAANAELGLQINNIEEMRKYYSTLMSEWEDLKQKNPAYMSTVAQFTGESNRFIELDRQLKMLAPIVLANRQPQLRRESGVDVFKTSFVETLIPATKAYGTTTNQQVLGDVMKSIETAGANPADIQKPTSERLKAAGEYEPFSSKDWGSTLGLTMGMIPYFAAAAPPTTYVLRGFGNATGATKAAQQIITNPRLYKFAKYIAGATETGLQYEAAGILAPHIQDEATFTSGFLGHAFAKPVEGLLSKVGAEKLIAKVFKENSDKAAEIINKIGGRISAGVGEVFEEYGNEIGNLVEAYAETGDGQQLQKDLDERFGTVSKNFHFAVMTFVMGAGMGSGNAIGRAATAKAQEAYNDLDEEEKEKFDEFVKETNHDIKTAHERSQGRDQVIEELRKAREEMGIHTDDNLFDDVPESVETTMDRFDAKLPVDPVAASEASQYLYDKWKELENMRDRDDNLYTTEQIDNLQSNLEADITKLENFINNEGRYEEETEAKDVQEQDAVGADPGQTQEEVEQTPFTRPQEFVGKTVEFRGEPHTIEKVGIDTVVTTNSKGEKVVYDMYDWEQNQPQESKNKTTEKQPVEVPEKPKTENISVFHGGSVKTFDKISKDSPLFVSEEKGQAEEYAKGNNGEVAEFTINSLAIAPEQKARDVIERLGLASKDSEWDVNELNLYELIDPNFDTSLPPQDIVKLYSELEKEGFGGIRFLDSNLKTLKNDINNVVVFNPGLVKAGEEAKPTTAPKISKPALKPVAPPISKPQLKPVENEDTTETIQPKDKQAPKSPKTDRGASKKSKGRIPSKNPNLEAVYKAEESTFQDIEDKVMLAFIGGEKVIHSEFKRLFKNGNEEARIRLQLIAKPSKGGKTIEKIAEDIWLDHYSETDVSGAEVLSAVENVLLGYSSPSQMAEHLVSKYGLEEFKKDPNIPFEHRINDNGEVEYFLPGDGYVTQDEYEKISALRHYMELSEEEKDVIEAVAAIYNNLTPEELEELVNGSEEVSRMIYEDALYQETGTETEETTEETEPVEPEEDLPDDVVVDPESPQGDNVARFKQDDIVYRKYDGQYYKIVKSKGSVWKLQNINTGAISDWNADNNGGFYLAETTVTPEEKPQPKQSRVRVKIEATKNQVARTAAAKDKKIDDLLGDFFDNTLTAGFNPEKAAKALEIMYRFVELGVYRFEEIVLTIIEKTPLEKVEQMWDYLKAAYAGAYQANKDNRALMTDLETLDTYTIDDFVERTEEEVETHVTPKDRFINEVKIAITENRKLIYPQLREIAERNGMVDETTQAPDKVIQEATEAAIIELAEAVNDGNGTQEQKLQRIQEIYDSQPSFTMRSSSRVLLGQFSTPITISFAAGEWINSANPKSGLEPSAGNGMMLSNVRNRKSFIVNEIDSDRYSNLARQYPEVMGINAGDISSINTYVDALVMNPPFGSTGSVKLSDFSIKTPIATLKNIEVTGLDKTHVLDALKLLKPNGVAAILINGNNEFREDGRLESPNDYFFFTYLHRNFNVVDVINIGADMYAKQGTTVPTRLILIDGRKQVPDQELFAPNKTERDAPLTTTQALISRINENIALREQRISNQGVGGGADVNDNKSRPDDQPRGGGTGSSSKTTGDGGGVSGNRGGGRSQGNQGLLDFGSSGTGNTGSDKRDTGKQPNDEGDVEDVSGSGGTGTDDKRGGDGDLSPDLVPARLPGDAVRDVDLDKLKQPYISQSQAPYEIGSVIPTGMAQQTYAVLSAFKDIDAYVANKLKITKAELGKILSKEQIDSVALAIYNIETGKSLVIGDMTGVGKGRSQPLTSKILTKTGWVEMGSLKVGDCVIGGDGKETVVTGVFPQGELPVYEVRFTDGTKTECSLDHLWAYKDKQMRDCYKKNPDQLYGQYKIDTIEKISTKLHRSVSIPLVGSIDFDKSDTPIDPYLLGVLLGDGCLRHHAIELTCDDDQILEICSGLVSQCDKNLVFKKTRHQHYQLSKNVCKRDSNGRHAENVIIAAIRRLGLDGKKAENKFIPELYKFSDHNTRLAVLQGLIDTDGYVSKTGVVQFSSASKQLSEDVAFIVRSMGGVARYKTKKTTHLPSHVVTITLPNGINPCRLIRKLDRVIIRKKYPPIKYIEAVEYIGDKECQCIAVSNSSRLYVTDDFIVTHNTGASVMLYAIRNGMKPIFVTKSAKLFTDFYRDMKAVGGANYLPFIMNTHTSDIPAHMYEVDENDNKTIVHTASIRDKETRMSNADLSGFDYVTTTYSQFNSERGSIPYNKPFTQNQTEYLVSKDGRIRIESPLDQQGKTIKSVLIVDGNPIGSYDDVKQAKSEAMAFSPNSKRSFLSAIAEGTVMVMDESHMAAGTGNTNAYFLSVMNRLKGVVYLSATSIKRPEAMVIYAMKNDIGKLNFGDMEAMNAVISAIMNGGVAMQEIVTRGLTQIGQMIRRERDMQDRPLTFEPITEDKNFTTKKFDEVSEAFNKIKLVSDLISEDLQTLKNSIAGGVGMEVTDALSVSNTPFASKMFVLINQLMMSLKSKAVAQEVIKEIEAGRKPIVSVNFTNESFFEEFDTAPGEKIPNPTFAWILKRALRNTLKVRIGDGVNAQTAWLSFADLPAYTQEAYRATEAYLNTIGEGLHISPIDEIINIVEDAGYSIGEMTGRKQRISKDNTVVPRRRDDIQTTADFQSGTLDAVLLNRSASTGISLHADKSAKDQKQRVLLVVQAQLDINEEIQVHGRNDRTGQTKRGAVRYLYLSVPAEQRLFMMLQNKLKSLLASTAAEANTEMGDAPDLLNKYGDQVAWETMLDNPGWAEALQNPLKSIGFKELTEEQEAKIREDVPEDAMDKVLKRMPFAKIAVQEKIFKELVDRYNVLINYLNEAGENDLVLQTLDLKAKTLRRAVAVEGQDPTNPFGGDTNIDVVEIINPKKPMTWQEIQNEIEVLKEQTSSLEDDATAYMETKKEQRREGIVDRTNRRIEREEEKLRKDLVEGKINENEFYDAKEKFARIQKVEMDEDLDTAENIEKYLLASKITSQIRRFVPGRRYRNMDNNVEYVFLGFKYNKPIPSQIVAVFATADANRKIGIPLSKIKEIGSLTYSSGVEDWDTFISRIKLTKEVKIVTGNLINTFKAYSGSRGKFISYTKRDGGTAEGYILPDNVAGSEIKVGQEKASSIGNKFLTDKKDQAMFGEFGLEIWRVSSYGTVATISVPKAKAIGGRYYLDPSILSITGDWSQKAGRMNVNVSEENLRKLLNYFDSKNINLYTESSESETYKEYNEDDEPEASREPETDYRSLADVVRQAKIDTKGNAFDATLGLPVAVWNAAVEIVAVAIQSGVAAGDALKRGLNYIQKNHRAKWNKSEYNNMMAHNLGMRGISLNGKDVFAKMATSQYADVVNGFYSDIEQAILDSSLESKPAEQWLGEFNKEEATWTGVAEFLKSIGGKQVSKSEIREYIVKNRIQILEIHKGDGVVDWVEHRPSPEHNVVLSYENAYVVREGDKYILKEEYDVETIEYQGTLEGAKNYFKDFLGDTVSPQSKAKYYDKTLSGTKDKYKEILVVLPTTASSTFQSKHFDEPNILVHIRTDIRKDADGKRVLFLEEVQSDWGQKGRDEGFVTDDRKEIAKSLRDEINGFYTPLEKSEKEQVFFSIKEYEDGKIDKQQLEKILKANGVSEFDLKTAAEKKSTPTAPFVTETSSWVKLGLKVALKEAVKQGAKRIAWTTGEQQNEMNSLERQVKQVEWNKYTERGAAKIVTITPIDGNLIELPIDKNGYVINNVGTQFDGKHIVDVVGKGIGNKITSENYGELVGEGLKVGGKAMKEFYGSPEEGKIGLIGSVLKSMTGQEPNTTKLPHPINYISREDAKKIFENTNVYIQYWGGGEKVADTETEIDEAADNGAKFFTESPSYSTQHSIEITPEIKAAAQTGLPLMSSDIGVKRDSRAFKRVMDKVAAIARSGKINKPGQMMSGTGFDQAWDLMMEAFAKSFEKLGNLAVAIEDAIKAMKSSEWYKGLTSNEKTAYEQQMRDHFNNEVKPQVDAVQNEPESEPDLEPVIPQPMQSIYSSEAPDAGSGEREAVKKQKAVVDDKTSDQIMKDFYDKTTNKYQAYLVEEFLKKHGLDEAAEMVIDNTTGLPLDVIIPLQMAIVRDYNAQKQYQKAARMIDLLGEYSTTVAKALQAHQLWQVMVEDPASVVAYVQRTKAKKRAIQQEAIDKQEQAIQKRIEEAAEAAAAAAVKDFIKNRTKSSTAGTKSAKPSRGLETKIENVRAKRIIDALDSMIITGGVYDATLGIPVAIWNAAIRMVKNAVVSGVALADAVQAAKQYIIGHGYVEEANKFVEKLTGKTKNIVEADILHQAASELGFKIGEVITQHLTERQDAKQSLVDKLVEEAGLDAMEAQELEKIVQEVFEHEANKRLRALGKKRYNKEGKQIPANDATTKLVQAINAGEVVDQDITNTALAILGLEDVDQDLLDEILRMAEAAASAPLGFQRQKAVADLMRKIANTDGISWSEVAWSLWYASLLSGPWTWAVNIASNTLNTLGEGITSTIQRAANGDFTGMFNWVSALLEGYARGTYEAWAVLTTGYEPLRTLKVADALEGQMHDLLESKEVQDMILFRGKLNPMKLAKYVRRIMVASDVMAYYGLKNMRALEFERAYTHNRGTSKEERKLLSQAMERAMAAAKITAAEYIHDEGLTGTDARRRYYEVVDAYRDTQRPGTEEASEVFAARGTFNYKPQGFLGEISNLIMQAHRSKNAVLRNVAKLTFPFVRIVANVLNQQIDYTPIGALRAHGNRYHKEAYEKQRALIRSGVGLAVTSAILYAIFQALEDDDENPWISITADGYGDYEKNKVLFKDGWKPYTMTINGVSFDYRYTPMAIMFTALGHYVDGKRYGKGGESEATAMDKALYVLLKTGGAVFDMSFLSGVNGLLGAIGERNGYNQEKNIRNYLSRTATTVIPNMLKQIDKQLDPTVYDDSTLKNAILREIPFAHGDQEKKYDVFGDPIVRQGNRIFTIQNPDKLASFLIKHDISIGGLSRKVADTRLTVEEYNKLKIGVGKELKRYLEENMSYLDQNMSSEQIQEDVDKEMERIRKRVKQELFSEYYKQEIE